MKLTRLLTFSLLICLVFPILASADQYDNAEKAIKDKDYKKACELLKPLADENNLGAMTLLGTYYYNGLGVEKDVAKGLALIMKAANQEYAPAKAVAVTVNRELAVIGDTSAMYNVGIMCLNGWGGEQDPKECIQWIEKAAENGHVKSAKALSRIYADGKFKITPDKEKASYWSNLAQK